MNAFVVVATALGPRSVDLLDDLGALVITPDLKNSRSYTLTHRATGYFVTKHSNRTELRKFARQLMRDFDWNFTDDRPPLTMIGVPPAILAWKEQVAK